jgi:hypothetical protein
LFPSKAKAGSAADGVKTLHAGPLLLAARLVRKGCDRAGIEMSRGLWLVPGNTGWRPRL